MVFSAMEKLRRILLLIGLLYGVNANPMVPLAITLTILPFSTGETGVTANWQGELKNRPIATIGRFVFSKCCLLGPRTNTALVIYFSSLDKNTVITQILLFNFEKVLYNFIQMLYDSHLCLIGFSIQTHIAILQ